MPARLAHRLAEPAARQAGLVERVAGLVQHAHQGRGDLVLAVARGEADVGRRAAAERVRALVEPAGVEVEAEAGHQLAGERFLALGRERAGRADGRRRLPLAGQDGVDDGRQLGREALEERDDGGVAQVGLVGVEERVVGR